MIHPFHPFGLTHLLTDLVFLAFCAAIVAWGRRVPLPTAMAAGRIFGITLIVYYCIDSALRVFVLGVRPALNWPFHYCGWVYIIGAYALISGRRAALQVHVLLSFAGVAHSLITPTPSDGFPSLEYVRYFLCHGLLVASAVYAAGVFDLRLTWRSVWNAIWVLQVYEIITAVIDWATGENYMYLRAPPPSPTLFDVLGPWPWYILSLEIVAPIFIVLFYAICSRVPAPAHAVT